MALEVIYRLQAYTEPLAFLAIAFYSFLLILLEILTLRLSPTILLSKQTLSSKIFSKTWLRIRSLIYQNELLTPLPHLLSHAHGTILELGPGSGNQVSRYDKARVTRIYGVEPNRDLHVELLRTVKREGLADVYTVVGRGVEEGEGVGEWGLGEGEGGVDCVVCVQVLCSVPAEKLEAVAGGLYRCLKKGGELIFYEHVRSDDAMSGFVQRAYNAVWPFFMGNCHLDRPIGEILLKAGKWERVEMEPRKEEEDWVVFPHVAGRLVK